MYNNNNITIISGTRAIIYKDTVSAAYGIIGYMYDHNRDTHKIMCMSQASAKDMSEKLKEVYAAEFKLIGEDMDIKTNGVNINVIIK